MSDFRVGIVGAGTIGAAVGRMLDAGAVPGASVIGFAVRSRPQEHVGPPLYEDVAELLDERPHAVVEAASHEALREVGEAVLARGCDLVCVSVGALADGDLRDRLATAAAREGSRLVVASGAIGGLDALAAAAEGGLDEVVVEQRKPPASLLAAADAAALTGPTVVFEGTVADVVSRYPKTTNVAAAVALAGLGFERTTARLVADPAAQANEAIVTARGAFGELRLELRNRATANPRTSALAAMSVVAALRRLADPAAVVV